MGYETELVIGRAHTPFPRETKSWFRVDATIDLRNCGSCHLLCLDWKRTQEDIAEYYWYAPTGDGSTEISIDPYDTQSKAIPIKLVIEALEKDFEKSKADYETGKGYRRFRWALGLLKAMIEDDGGEELSVIIFGH